MSAFVSRWMYSLPCGERGGVTDWLSVLREKSGAESDTVNDSGICEERFCVDGCVCASVELGWPEDVFCESERSSGS